MGNTSSKAPATALSTERAESSENSLENRRRRTHSKNRYLGRNGRVLFSLLSPYPSCLNEPRKADFHGEWRAPGTIEFERYGAGRCEQDKIRSGNDIND